MEQESTKASQPYGQGVPVADVATGQTSIELDNGVWDYDEETYWRTAPIEDGKVPKTNSYN